MCLFGGRRQVLGHRSYDPTTIREGEGEDYDGGGGLWLKNVRRIEDYEHSAVKESVTGEPRLRAGKL